MPTLDNMLTVCYGCRTLIDDRYYLMAVDRSWHLSCLKCFDCGMSLEQERTCFARYGQIFCKDDYIKRYCSRVCTRCHTIIRQDEVILRAKQFIFHLDCFTCVTCNILLHPGDEFGLKDDMIFCRHHYFEQQQSYESQLPGRVLDIGIENSTISVPTGFLDDSGYYTSPIPTLIPSTPPTNTSTPTGTTVNITKRTRKRKERQQNQHHEMMSSSDHFLTLSPSSSNMVGNEGALFTPSLDSSYYVDIVDMDGNGSNNSNNNNIHSHQTNNNNLSSGSHHHHHHHTRQKRVRTSFKHHQLRCMRSYFNLNHNPDAKDLKNLAEKTNLPKRVLQVWFQNARAK
ncbi:unnamed protein product, partial [Rotaria socialis]